MVFALLPVSALEAGDFVSENGVLVQHTSAGGNVVIPDSVTGIGDSVFFQCSALTGVSERDARAVARAVEQGITSGVGGNKFAPKEFCTRGQIVTFLYRAFAK